MSQTGRSNGSQATARSRASAPALDRALEERFDEALGITVADAEDDADAGPEPLEGDRAGRHDPGLRRYLRWQALDFLRHRAIFLLPLGIVALMIFEHNFGNIVAEAMDGDTGQGRTVQAGFELIVRFAALVGGALGAILSTHGVVSRDRERGHQRFLFAKPVRVTSFYLQAFAVNAVGTLAVVATLLGLTSLVFLRPVPFFEPMLGAATAYAAVGGLTFLLSTLVRFELALAGGLTLLSVLLHAAAHEGRWWGVAFSWLLPPVHQLQAFMGDTTAQPGQPGRPTMFTAVTSLFAYGAAYVGAGIAVLRKRSIIG